MRVAVFLLALVVCFLGLNLEAPPADANDLTSCGKCHNWAVKPLSNVTGFVLSVPYGGGEGTSVDKSRCIVCHSWDTSRHVPGLRTVPINVNGVVYGYFKGLESIYQPPAFLHNIHNAVSVSKLTGLTCATCHTVASCTSCHVSVPHRDHYTSNPINLKTGQNLFTPTLEVSTGQVRFEDGVVYSTWRLPMTCAAAECHQTLPAPRVKRSDNTELCFNCHSTGMGGHQNIEAKHNSGFLDKKCLTCHKSNLTEEHMENVVTQNSHFTCSVCHGSSSSQVRQAISANDASCSACHYEAHGLNLVNSVPPEIPLYNGLKWSLPQPVTIWAGESWIDPAYFDSGQVIMSERMQDKSTEIWDFYSVNLPLQGWALQNKSPDTSSLPMKASYSKKDIFLTVWLFQGETPDDVKSLQKGIRSIIIYKKV